MDLGIQGDLVIFHEMIRLLPKIKNKWWGLGKTITQLGLPKEIKDPFFSLGNDLNKFLELSHKLGTAGGGGQSGNSTTLATG